MPSHPGDKHLPQLAALLSQGHEARDPNIVTGRNESDRFVTPSTLSKIKKKKKG